MKITKREMTLGSITLAIILFGGTWFLITEHLDTWKGMKSEIEQAERKIQLHKTAISQHETWRGELVELQNELKVFSLEDPSVTPTLLKEIKQISSRHKLDILRTQPYTEKKIDDLYELGINCTWKGSLEALVYFLAELQEKGARFDVRQLNVTPEGKGGNELKGSMVINCAYLRTAEPSENNG